jgi:hypothetical protein
MYFVPEEQEPFAHRERLLTVKVGTETLTVVKTRKL